MAVLHLQDNELIPGIPINLRTLPLRTYSMGLRNLDLLDDRLIERGWISTADLMMFLGEDGEAQFNHNCQLRLHGITSMSELSDFLIYLYDQHEDAIPMFVLRRDLGLNLLQFFFNSQLFSITVLINTINTFWNRNVKDPQLLEYVFDDEIEFPEGIEYF